MDRLERLLGERSSQLVEQMTCDAGLTRDEAAALLAAAAADLVQSYRWQSESWADTGDHAAQAKEVLAVMNAREIGPRAGMSSARTWAGLRCLVPAALGGAPLADEWPAASGLAELS
ncbi:MAG: hypothetical protein ACPHQP_04530 [Longimicrobiales bacterium]